MGELAAQMSEQNGSADSAARHGAARTASSPQPNSADVNGAASADSTRDDITALDRRTVDLADLATASGRLAPFQAFAALPATLAASLAANADRRAQWRSVADANPPDDWLPRIWRPSANGNGAGAASAAPASDAPSPSSLAERAASHRSASTTAGGDLRGIRPAFDALDARDATPSVRQPARFAVNSPAAMPGVSEGLSLAADGTYDDDGYATDAEEDLGHGGPARGPLTQSELRDELLSHSLRVPSSSLRDLRRREAEASKAREGAQGLYCPVGSAPRLPLPPQSVVFVASEVAPWSKTGGLADVMGSLPVALASRGHRVMVVSPRYITSDEQREDVARLTDMDKWVRLDLGRGEHWVNFHHERRAGVDWVFVQHLSFERPGTLYGNWEGPYQDNMFRFTLLSLAALEATLQLELPVHPPEPSHMSAPGWRLPGSWRHGAKAGSVRAYGERVIFVANDWHAGMVPVYLRHKFQAHGIFKDALAMLAVHNLAFQGTALAPEFDLFNLPPSVYNVLEWIYKEPDGRLTPVVNIMKAALLMADRVLTVSEHYAWEITQELNGMGLQSVLQQRADVLNGIVNGISLEEWNPETDPHIDTRYSRRDLRGKQLCKQALKRKLKLPESSTCDVPLVGFIGRLDHQKGPDVVLDALSGIIAMDCQVVMLGSGSPEYGQRIERANADMPDFFKGVVTFSSPLAHEIIAGCDILLMPSRFEPCGLNQLYAMRYGTVPVACATGGLNDTIDDVSPFARSDEATGTGWTFSTPTPRALLSALKSAVQVYRSNPARWRNIQLEGMNRDFSWDRAAAAYESVICTAMATSDNAALREVVL